MDPISWELERERALFAELHRGAYPDRKMRPQPLEYRGEEAKWGAVLEDT